MSSENHKDKFQYDKYRDRKIPDEEKVIKFRYLTTEEMMDEVLIDPQIFGCSFQDLNALRSYFYDSPRPSLVPFKDNAVVEKYLVSLKKIREKIGNKIVTYPLIVQMLSEIDIDANDDQQMTDFILETLTNEQFQFIENQKKDLLEIQKKLDKLSEDHKKSENELLSKIRERKKRKKRKFFLKKLFTV